jgi:predicted transcriptional regulator
MTRRLDEIASRIYRVSVYIPEVWAASIVS